MMQKQADIRNAIKPFHGDAAADALKLRQQNIADAVEVVTAANAGDKSAPDKAGIAAYANAHGIADFLAKANKNWPQATIRDTLKNTSTRRWSMRRRSCRTNMPTVLPNVRRHGF